MSVIIMVDGGASISKRIMKEHNLVILPYGIFFGNNQVEVRSNEELLRIIAINEEFPRYEFVEEMKAKTIFEEYLNNGDDILCITTSSKINDNYERLRKIANDFESKNIEIIDSENISCGETLLAIYASEYLSKGYGLRQIANYLNKVKSNIKSFYSVGNNNYLYLSPYKQFLKGDYLHYLNKHSVIEIDKGIPIMISSSANEEVSRQLVQDEIYDYSSHFDKNHLLLVSSYSRPLTHKYKWLCSRTIKGVKIELLEGENTFFSSFGKDSFGCALLVDED